MRNGPNASAERGRQSTPPAALPQHGDKERGCGSSRFDLQEKLGNGGMGVVYSAIDRRSGRKVALKFLTPHLAASGDRLERLRREAHAIASLNHPGVETLYEFDEFEGRPCLVLEYLPGGTLQKKLAKIHAHGEFLPYHTVLSYAIQVAEGLAHAHGHGVLHRDIKPGNLMFTEDGRLKITDFGLAKLRDPVPDRVTDEMLGTVAYMSPEQVHGGEADERSDIYSYGVVLFEMLTGVVPFLGVSTAATLYRIAHEPPPSLRHFRPDVPRGFGAILDRVLRKKPSERYPSMQRLLQDLLALEKEVEFAAARETKQDTVVGQDHPFPYGIAFAAGVALLFATLYAGGFLLPASDLKEAVMVPWRMNQQEELRVVVLPCRNHGSETDAAICAGLLDILTTRLMESDRFRSHLRIFPQGVVEAKNITDPAQARRRLAASHAIEISLTRLDDRVSFSLKLIKTNTCEILAGRTIEFRQEELAGLDKAVLDAVAGLLHLHLPRQG